MASQANQHHYQKQQGLEAMSLNYWVTTIGYSYRLDYYNVQLT